MVGVRTVIRLAFTTKGASVKKEEMRSNGESGNRNRERGFTIVELAVVAILIVTIGAMAMIQLMPTLRQSQTNVGMAEVKDTLREARETAISERRSIVVKFVASASGTPCLPAGSVYNCIELFLTTVVPSGTTAPPTITTATTPYLTIPIEPTVQFMTFAGEADTPDAYGLPGAPNGVYFGGVLNGPVGGMQFQSDGTFTDISGNAIVGTAFLGVPNMPASARAVTILGNTGRVHSFRFNGSGWIQ
jgi:Tfp pilus assembly protein FimT